MIKPYNNGGFTSVVDYVKHKVMISYTPLNPFIPPQVCRMTPKLSQIFGCEHFIISKDMQIDLNTFRTRLVKYLQYKYVETHPNNSLFSTKRDVNHKKNCFQMVNVYMLLSKLLLSASPVLLLNQII